MWATARRGWGVLALALVAMAAAGVGADTAVEIGPTDGERDNFPADVFGMRDGGGSLDPPPPNVTVPPPMVPPRPLPPMPPIPRMPPPTLTPGMPPPEAPGSPPTPTPPDAPSPPEKAPPSPPLPEPPDAPDAPTPPTSNASTWPTRCSPRRVPRADRCEFVRKTHSCQSEHHLVPYLTMHYCWTDAGVWSAVSQALVIASLFYILATVAERFFCPALENIAAALRIPEDVAGATLLSFGNGAPDW